ncbi:hypothetical protein ACQ4M4_14795 [Leptolyngbya sp. AN02str]|uniref:hypothetical protein n=1 Tax=Leptolyngbya sp. AN02str TaxID=3423363 RepID=UPI003D312452
MRHQTQSQNQWRRIGVRAALLSCGLSVSFTAAAIANRAQPQVSQRQPQASRSERQPELQIAQEPNACYRVVAEDGLYVREEPTVYSEALAILNFGQPVTIAPDGTGGTEYWAPIATPIPGYVWADWLAPC